MSLPDEFDYVIVGAGSAGCVLAGRLSATPEIRVLLIEANDNQKKERIRQLTPEQSRELRTLEAESRGRIRQILTEEQAREYDRRVAAH